VHREGTLKEFLEGYKFEAALVMHWIIVGPSGRETRPQRGGLLRHYQQCRKVAARVVKSIANTYFLANIAGNPHTLEYRCAPAASPALAGYATL
jgi:hypothetical protein